MKKHLLFAAIIATAICAKGQVGIGTATPHSSAELDITSTNKGFLLPRMTSASRLAIVSPATGLMVYQTDGVSGYYYYNGSSWQQLNPPGWSLTGNTNPTNDYFLGTTDLRTLYFKTNGELSGTVSPDLYLPLTLGYLAGKGNKVSYLTAIGYKAVSQDNEGHHVTAVGFRALEKNKEHSNTAVGSLALPETSTGVYNTAVGAWALRYLTTGIQNTVVGAYVVDQLQTGSGNTVVGAYGGFNLRTGEDNTMIGRFAGPTNEDATNTIAVGYGAQPTADNRVRIGNNSISQIGGVTGWSNLSDERFKKDIRSQDHGLDFIMQLKPITYHINVEKLNRFTYGEKADSLFGSASARMSIASKESILYSGFSAQQVEEAARQIGYDFSGVQKPANERDHYALDYSAFVIPLVKAMQEQQALIEALNKEIEILKRQVKEFTKPANK